MATAGERAAASAYGGGGVGGKFRKRPFRKIQTTPYERPPTALRNSSWLSKLVVDPASKLLAAGAQRFFSSVFRKRLPNPPPPLQLPEEKQELRNGLHEADQDNCAGPREPAEVGCGGSICNNDTSGFSELEQLLKQKKFTRSEINRISELLHSRAVDIPVKNDGVVPGENISTQNNSPDPMSRTEMHQNFPVSSERYKIEKVQACGVVSAPTVNKMLEDEVASPAELARAYMVGRPVNVSTSKLGLGSPIAREDGVLLNNSPFTSNPAITSMNMKSSSRVGVPQNGFTTPRSHGRSAIYNMARTPYSRFHPSPIQKVSGSRNYGHSRPSSSSSEFLLDNGGPIGSKPTAIKRRSSVLDDEIGSAGPMRRIRQKPNLLSHGISLPSRGTTVVSDAAQLHKLPLVDETKNKALSTSSTNYAHVPPESSEMAARIFEHLERMTPKEKSSESKLAAAREKSSFKLTPNMLRGQALKSLEDLDASKLLPNSQTDRKSSDQPSGSLHGSRDSASHKQGRVEENGRGKITHPVEKLTPMANTDDTTSVRDIKLTTEDASTKFIPQTSERRQAFKMSAFEDSFELDDDVPSNEPVSKLAENRVTEKSSIGSKLVPGEAQAFFKTPGSSEERTHPVLDLRGSTDLDTSKARTAENGFALSDSQAPVNSQSALPSQSALASEKTTTLNDSPLFASFISKTAGNGPSSTEANAENSNRSTNLSTVTNDAKVFNSESDMKSSQLLEGSGNLPSGVVSSLASKPMSTISIASPGASFSSLASNNWPLASSAPVFSSSAVPVSSTLANFTTTSSSMVSVTCTVTTASTSGASSTGLVEPIVPSSPVSKFVSSKDPPSAISAAPSTGKIETTGLKDNADKETSFGKLSNSSVGTMSASSGSSIFRLGSFVSSPAANNHLDGPDSASGAVVSTQPFSSGSGIATVSQSMPVQSGSASFASWITSSSAPGASPQSSASLSETNTSSGGAPSVSKFGVGTSALEVKPISSSSSATLGTFTFGASSTSLSSSNSSSVTPGFLKVDTGLFSSSSVSFSTPTPAAFNFGPGSSAAASSTSSSSVSPGIFSFGVGSSSSPSNAVFSSSTTAPSIFSFNASNPASSAEANSVSSAANNSSPFGSNWQAPNGSTINASSPSTGFSFGASSSSFGLTNTSPLVFGSTAGASSSSPFSFAAASTTTSSLPSLSTQTVFGTSTSAFAAPPGNSDQMSMEDSMAEDPVQSSATATPAFGQSPAAPSPSGFMFGSNAPSPAASFQFGGQQSQPAPQANPFQQSGGPAPQANPFQQSGGPAPQSNPFQQSGGPAPQANPFQQSGSLEFGAGGSFSLGSGGGDKGRKIVKPNRNRNRKR